MPPKTTPASVTLVSPAGDDTTVTRPAALHSLVYGSGYRPKTGTIDDAIATLTAAGQDPGVADPAPTPPTADVVAPAPPARTGKSSS